MHSNSNQSALRQPSARSRSGSQRWRTAAYALTIFSSAFLLFQVQPIMGRIVLPWFGGSAAVWTICLLFFQTLLLLGYLYAHALNTLLRASAQRWVHLLLLCISATALPLSAAQSWKPSDSADPTLRILLLLGSSVGLPYFVLSATSPLLQAWFARHRDAALPYRLFALSNFGSMTALLSYPFLIEPMLTLRQQALLWSAGYVLFALCCAAIGWQAGGDSNRVNSVQRPSEHGSLRMLSIWTGLALCPSAALLAITTHLTQNVAPIPLLWIVPLALYLLSFMLCFESSRWYRRAFWIPLLLALLIAMTIALIDNGRLLGLGLSILLFCVGLFAIAMVCHGELAALKPEASGLTRFYLMVALGGMLGGVCVGVLAPRIFAAYYELPIVLAASMGVAGWAMRKDLAAWFNRGNLRTHHRWLLLPAVMLLAALAYRPIAIAHESRIMMRNFFGVLRTKDWTSQTQTRRALYHGRIVHGMQFIGDARRRLPTTYYAANSGVGLAISEAQRRGRLRVGVVGLGAGTLAAYARAGDAYAFYEIDPNVIELARREFTYLADCPGAIAVYPGDARLVLERQPVQRFDVLVVDAFTADAIPTHLLTREAFSLYAQHLAPDGLLAVNVSNRYLDLSPVVKQSAAAAAMEARVVDTQGDADRISYGATWVIATREPRLFERGHLQVAKPIEQTVPVWSDDYSSIYRVLRR